MNRVEYEREPCGRCGGSGRYSHNQIDGDRCYGCGGSGQRLTKRGAAARAFATEMLTVDAGDVRVGERVTYTDALTGRRTTITVTSAETARAGSIISNGQERPLEIITLTGKQGSQIAVSKGITLRRVPTAEQIEEINAYQANLTKAGKPRKRPVR